MIEVAEEQAKDKVWREVISWVEQGRVLEKKETKGKAREVLVACSMLDLEVFKMREGVFMFTTAANRNQIAEVWGICLPESIVTKVWSLCHQTDLGGHRGLEGTLSKFINGFLLLSARQKIRFLNSRCDTVERFHRMLTAILQTWGPRVQENWDLWLNALVFAYNTTVSSITGVTPHYAMFGHEARLPKDWVFSTPSVEKRTMYHWTGDMMEVKQ